MSSLAAYVDHVIVTAVVVAAVVPYKRKYYNGKGSKRISRYR